MTCLADFTATSSSRDSAPHEAPQSRSLHGRHVSAVFLDPVFGAWWSRLVAKHQSLWLLNILLALPRRGFCLKCKLDSSLDEIPKSDPFGSKTVEMFPNCSNNVRFCKNITTQRDECNRNVGCARWVLQDALWSINHPKTPKSISSTDDIR